jgi:hypothetical protein
MSEASLFPRKLDSHFLTFFYILCWIRNRNAFQFLFRGSSSTTLPRIVPMLTHVINKCTPI